MRRRVVYQGKIPIPRKEDYGREDTKDGYQGRKDTKEGKKPRREGGNVRKEGGNIRKDGLYQTWGNVGQFVFLGLDTLALRSSKTCRKGRKTKEKKGREEVNIGSGGGDSGGSDSGGDNCGGGACGARV
jgi:hypothetical protein